MQATNPRGLPETDRPARAVLATSTDIELRIPANHVHVRLARLAASGVGAQFGANVEQIEELRLLVDEACALLLECTVPGDATDDRLTVTFRPTAEMVTMIAERHGAGVADHPSPISVSVLDAISDEWSLEGATVRVRVLLRDSGRR